MSKFLVIAWGATPRKLMSLLVVCLLGVCIVSGSFYNTYLNEKEAVQTVGKDTVPSVVAAEHIQAVLADANANAMNAILEREDISGKYWKKYRSEMDEVDSQLVTASKNITYGDEERLPILKMMDNIGRYEYLLGSVATDVSVDKFEAANKLMQEQILPASISLNKANYGHLTSAYTEHTSNVKTVFWASLLICLALLALLLWTQYFLFRKTNRLVNVGLALATLILLVVSITIGATMSSVEEKMRAAKQDAFDSVNALWTARADTYNGNAFESLYLLHHGNTSAQNKDTEDFKTLAVRITDIDPKNALSAEKYKGYLGDELRNITFDGEKELAVRTTQEWSKYLVIDKQIRELESSGRYDEAVKLCLGTNVGESDYQFNQFDTALGKVLELNEGYFSSYIDKAFSILSVIPYLILGMFLLVIGAVIFGMRPRLKEYSV